MQADPSQPGMWKSVMTQDGQMGVTIPAPPAYSPPQGPWYTAPIVTVSTFTANLHCFRTIYISTILFSLSEMKAIST